METEHQPPKEGREHPQLFATTHWSAIYAAAHSSPEAHAALERVCRAYRDPLLVRVRSRWRRSHADAEDIVQDFFADQLERRALFRGDAARGRFRDFLQRSLDNFILNRDRRDRAQKRGGGQVAVPLHELGGDAGDPGDVLDAEPPGMSTDPLYDREWAETLVARVRDRLRQSMTGRNRGLGFDALEPFLAGGQEESYEAAARRLGVTEEALKSTIHRFRQRHRQFIREEIAVTVDSPAEIEAEWRYLVEVLARCA